jgi:putative serine protease PepD
MKYVATLILALVFLTVGTVNVSAQDEALADFQHGAVRLIDKCLPSIVLIYMGGGGSGFIVDREGYIFTNFHVAGSTHVVEVRTMDGETYTAVVVGTDNTIDFCLLKIIDPPDDLVPIALADSDLIKPGDICMSMGSPGGSAGPVDPDDFIEGWLASNTCNLGLVNTVENFQQATRFANQSESAGGYGMHLTYIFNIDAEVNAGNSGGPSVNARGEVIGINTYALGNAQKGPYEESMNWCVPINHHKKAARDIINYGKPRWPYLGVDILPREITSLGRNYFGGQVENPFIDPTLPDPKEGHEIRYVSPESPAYEAGLRVGDRILSFNGEKFKNPFDLLKHLLMNHEVGDEVRLVVRRNERIFPDVRVVLGEKFVLNDQQDTLAMSYYSQPMIRFTY